MRITAFFKTIASLFVVASFGVSPFAIAPAAAALDKLQVGMEAPEFSLATVSGEPRKDGELKGEKLTALVFWSTWSRNSSRVLSRMEEIYQKYREQGLSVVAINVENQVIDDNDVAAINKVLGELKITFPVLLDRGLVAFHDFGVIAVPTTVVVDTERLIQSELAGAPLVGFEELVDFVSATIEGRALTAEVEQRAGYRPDKKALRMWNMGNRSLSSKRMASMAEKWFKNAIKADPGFVLPYISLGKFYLSVGNVDDAAEQFAAALEKEPENAVALCELGMLRATAGKVDEGKALINKALEVTDSYAPSFYYLGYVLGKEGQIEDAEKWFGEAVGVNPNDYNTYLYKAKLYEERGDLKTAAEGYRSALALMTR